MQLTSVQKTRISQIVNTYETGKPEGDYGAISMYADGPHRIRQITYGRSQTTEYGHLRELVEMYVDAQGTWSQALKVYVDRIGAEPLVDDAGFKTLLRQAGRKDVRMQEVQDHFFDEKYFKPAMAWADQNGFTLPLSALVIYDSFIHSGSILWSIRKRFAANPPAQGGQERVWVQQYVEARQEWLAGHANPIVRKTTYRTADMLREIRKGNWDLDLVPYMANGVAVS